MKNLGILLSLAVYDGVDLLLLYKRNSPTPWSRLDIFSGCYLLLGTVLAVQQMAFANRLSPSGAKDVFFARHIQPGWNRWVAILGILEWAAFYDYGHVQTVPFLESLPFRIAGLVVEAIAVAWLFWVDAYLIDNFVPLLESKLPMTDGPYRLMRHPRYAGLLATRVAFPLLIPSIVSCMLTVGWFLLVRRRMELEEKACIEAFGPLYETYMRRTPRVLALTGRAQSHANV